MKKMSVLEVSKWDIIKPDKCGICGEDAEYVLRAFSFRRGVRYEVLCEKHRQGWINGILCI